MFRQQHHTTEFTYENTTACHYDRLSFFYIEVIRNTSYRCRDILRIKFTTDAEGNLPCIKQPN